MNTTAIKQQIEQAIENNPSGRVAGIIKQIGSNTTEPTSTALQLGLDGIQTTLTFQQLFCLEQMGLLGIKDLDNGRVREQKTKEVQRSRTVVNALIGLPIRVCTLWSNSEGLDHLINYHYHDLKNFIAGKFAIDMGINPLYEVLNGLTFDKLNETQKTEILNAPFTVYMGLKMFNPVGLKKTTKNKKK